MIIFSCNRLLLSQAKAPIDVGTIELLIDRHKKQHDRLEERNKREIEHNTANALVKDIANKYEQLHKNLVGKYALASQWVNIGISAAGIIPEFQKLGKAIPRFIEYANEIKNPFVLQKYLRAAKRIKSEIEFCIKASASIPALRLNAQELTELVSLIKEHLYRIRYLLETYTRSIRGQVLYNKEFSQPKLPDYAKIANEIIQEYYIKEQ